MNKRQPAVLFKRTYTNKNGAKSVVWWYYTTDDAGVRRRFSLGTRSKTEARARLLERIREGDLLPQRIRPTRFADFTRGFWDWERSPYLRSKRLRGDKISRHWAHQNSAYLENHLRPALGSIRLTEISPRSVEALMMDLRESAGLSNKTLNSLLGCLRAILGEAKRQGLVTHNAAVSVRPLRNTFRRRGIPSLEEVRRLFASPLIWDNVVHYAVNLTACTTGARLGELRALKVRKLLPDRLIIDSVCRHMEGYIEGETKTGSRGWRIIPIPELTSRVLRGLIVGRSPEDFVFSLDGKNPIGANTATRALHRALAAIGVSEEEQRRRNLDFHSWRHLYGSILRGQVADSDLRSVTGHVSAAMTERYSHRIPERIEQFAAVQQEAFSQVLPVVDEAKGAERKAGAEGATTPGLVVGVAEVSAS